MIRTTVSCEETQAFRNKWFSIKNFLDGTEVLCKELTIPIDTLGEAMASKQEAVTSGTNHIKKVVANLVVAKAACRERKSTETREDIVSNARKLVEALSVNVSPCVDLCASSAS